jgi:L-aminopeptidase/D-esterase-like protein
MIWEVPGVSVGHWSDQTARTGCTAVLFDPPAVASGEVRGAAPATREFELLDPMASVQRIDAVMLSGGSAFGLAAAHGAMDWCEQHERGFPTPAGRVPIVVAMSLFDLAVGDASVRPDAAAGHAACDAAPQETPRLRRCGDRVHPGQVARHRRGRRRWARRCGGATGRAGGGRPGRGEPVG